MYWLIIYVILARSVFWALFGAIYLCFGMPEVYRVLFEVFGMEPEAEDCQPRLRRQLEDVDYVSVEFDGNKLSWQDIATYKVSFDFFYPSFVDSLLVKMEIIKGKVIEERDYVLWQCFCVREPG